MRSTQASRTGSGTTPADLVYLQVAPAMTLLDHSKIAPMAEPATRMPPSRRAVLIENPLAVDRKTRALFYSYAPTSSCQKRPLAASLETPRLPHRAHRKSTKQSS